jgi:hypothetical protein
VQDVFFIPSVSCVGTAAPSDITNALPLQPAGRVVLKKELVILLRYPRSAIAVKVRENRSTLGRYVLV